MTHKPTDQKHTHQEHLAHKKALEQEFHLIDQAEKHQKHHEHLLRVELNEAIKADTKHKETEENQNQNQN